MKKLELGTSEIFKSREHIDLLTEMCSELIGPATAVSDYGDYEIFISEGEHMGSYPWLEMCLLQLPKALANPNNRAWDISIRQAYHLHEFYHHPKHPVDYLYQEFKDQTAWVKKD